MTSRPILPIPTMPNILLRSSVPTKACLFHSPLFIALSPTEIFRESVSIIATVCSAADMVLTSGVFMTTIPRRVAAGISILSTPTPARPMAWRFSADAIISSVIFVPLRIIQPCTSLHASAFSSGVPFGRLTTSNLASFKTAMPLSVIGSDIRIFITLFNIF